MRARLMPPAGTPAAHHTNSFDFLRFVLASLVIFSHSYPLLTGTNDHEPLLLATGGQITAGELAVDAFFLISGLLIVGSWQRSSRPVLFLWRRVRRIAPALLVVALVHIGLLFVISSHPGFDQSIWIVLRAAIGTLKVPGLFVQNPQPYVPNGSLWTIKYEVVCYLLVPCGGVLGLYRRPRVLLVMWWVMLV